MRGVPLRSRGFIVPLPSGGAIPYARNCWIGFQAFSDCRAHIRAATQRLSQKFTTTRQCDPRAIQLAITSPGWSHALRQRLSAPEWQYPAMLETISGG